jgi:hypothetical protein
LIFPPPVIGVIKYYSFSLALDNCVATKNHFGGHLLEGIFHIRRSYKDFRNEMIREILPLDFVCLDCYLETGLRECLHSTRPSKVLYEFWQYCLLNYPLQRKYSGPGQQILKIRGLCSIRCGTFDMYWAADREDGAFPLPSEDLKEGERAIIFQKERYWKNGELQNRDRLISADSLIRNISDCIKRIRDKEIID